MYKRFLNNNDYIGIITEEALNQLIRNNEERLSQAEEAAEASIVEYLTDNYEVEKELMKGKMIAEYTPAIAYPVGAHFYHDGKIYKVIRSITSAKKPSDLEYWMELEDYNESKVEKAAPYRQLRTWQTGDVVKYAGTYYECIEPNGYEFNDIRIPGISGWIEVEGIEEWAANYDDYQPWDVVKYEDCYYALLKKEGLELTVNPYDSDNWGMIGQYDITYQYEFKDTEYVVYNDKVYVPTMKPTADELKENYNICLHDPRNSNIKKHLIRLALYELHKLISPNNISSARITDYETSITWLRDANRCKINPQIPRKLDHEHKPITEYAIATYMRDYDPYKNPWQI
jgi:hypothetical protein